MFQNALSRILAVAVLLTSGAAFAGVDIEDGARTGKSSLSTVNKQIRIGDDAEVGNVKSVNGGITIGALSVVGEVETVNGGIRIDDGSTALSVDSVNGGIRIGRDVQIEKDLETVNGSIEMDRGGRIGGKVGTVNGTMNLEGVLIEGDVTTINGAIHLKDGTEVMGDLIVKKPNGWGGWGKRKPVVVKIGPKVVVHGDLYFEHKVRLTVDPSATIGEVHGKDVDWNESRRR